MSKMIALIAVASVVTAASAATLAWAERGAAAKPSSAYSGQMRRLCPVDDFAQPNKKCKAGDQLLFAPTRWGNEQYPVLFAATYCDHDKSIALTNGAVSCVYHGLRDGK